MKRLVRKKRLVVMVLGLVGISFWVFQNRWSGSPVNPQYQTAQVGRGMLVSSVSSSGQVATTGRVLIGTNVSGQVQTVYVKNGDSVTAGQKILSLALDSGSTQKSAAAWNSYLQATTQLAAAQAKINSLQSTLFKANQAFVTDKGILNPTAANKADPKYIEESADWLAAEADYKNQQGVITQAQAAVSAAWFNYQLSSPDIVAPISGTVTDLTTIAGMVISAQSSSTGGINPPQTIAAVLTNTLPSVTINLAETDVNKVAEGAKVTVTLDALPGKTYTGKIIGINKTGVVAQGVTNYPATIQMDTAPTDVLPNMSASVSIIVATKDEVLLVPSEAVQTNTSGTYVRVLRNGQVQNVPVETGLTSDTQTEIISGPSEGETVVTNIVTTSTTTTGGQSPFSSTFRFGGGGRGR